MAIAVADTPEQWLKLLADPEVNVIRSVEDWNDFVALDAQSRIALFEGTPYKGVDPFRGVPGDAIRAFSATLVFKGRGLAHADYSALAQMPDTQLAALWASFGISDKLTSDYVDKYCAGTGNCGPKSDYICTSNC